MCPAVHMMSNKSNSTNVGCLSRSIAREKRNVCSNLAPLDRVVLTLICTVNGSKIVLLTLNMGHSFLNFNFKTSRHSVIIVGCIKLCFI